jgi:hypothetical protein
MAFKLGEMRFVVTKPSATTAAFLGRDRRSHGMEEDNAAQVPGEPCTSFTSTLSKLIPRHMVLNPRRKPHSSSGAAVTSSMTTTARSGRLSTDIRSRGGRRQWEKGEPFIAVQHGVILGQAEASHPPSSKVELGDPTSIVSAHALARTRTCPRRASLKTHRTRPDFRHAAAGAPDGSPIPVRSLRGVSAPSGKKRTLSRAHIFNGRNLPCSICLFCADSDLYYRLALPLC